MNTVDIYQKKDGKYNNNVLTKLINNYRSHSAILKVPNQLFYDGELKEKGDDLINIAVGWEFLPNPKLPLFYHHIVGKDVKESTSPR